MYGKGLTFNRKTMSEVACVATTELLSSESLQKIVEEIVVFVIESRVRSFNASLEQLVFGGYVLQNRLYKLEKENCELKK